jgi:hypothetical protein
MPSTRRFSPTRKVIYETPASHILIIKIPSASCRPYNYLSLLIQHEDVHLRASTDVSFGTKWRRGCRIRKERASTFLDKSHFNSTSPDVAPTPSFFICRNFASPRSTLRIDSMWNLVVEQEDGEILFNRSMKWPRVSIPTVPLPNATCCNIR